ncbi:MAG: ribosome assembly RNA-binding protein YhbY [Ruminococcus sp.]|nr:ribosome assembly RNA-binding protein YhbY [Ruminococcus sp.]
MITTKQRAYLKSLATSLQPAFQVGKGGVNDAQVMQIDDYLRVHEIIKIKVLDNSMYTAREAAEEIAERIDAEVVQVIGSKAVLYKKNPEKPVIELK